MSNKPKENNEEINPTKEDINIVELIEELNRPTEKITINNNVYSVSHYVAECYKSYLSGNCSERDITDVEAATGVKLDTTNVTIKETKVSNMILFHTNLTDITNDAARDYASNAIKHGYAPVFPSEFDERDTRTFILTDESDLTDDAVKRILTQILNGVIDVPEDTKKQRALYNLFASKRVFTEQEFKAALVEHCKAAKIRADVYTPLTNISRELFQGVEILTTPGNDKQLMYSFIQSSIDAKDLNNKPTTIPFILSADFDKNDLTISHKLEPYDFEVLRAIYNIYRENRVPGGSEHVIMTIRRIHDQMGYKSAMNKNTSTKIEKSILKLGNTNLDIDNADESKRSKDGKIKRYRYNNKMLHMEFISVSVKGGVTESAIKVLQEPFLIHIADANYKQITTVPIILLQSGITKTNFNLSIEQYLTFILKYWKKHKMLNPSIKWETLYKGIKIPSGNSGKKQRFNARKVTEEYLEYFKRIEFIKDYKTDATKIDIVLSDTIKNLEQ